MINVSDIRIKTVKPQNGLVGFASCVINGIFFVGNIAIFDEDCRQKITYPTKAVKGRYETTNEPTFRPVTSEARQDIEEAILNQYNMIK